MARHHEADRVLADRGADRARRLRIADLGGDVGIGDELAHRDGQQLLPHPHLEIGADQHHAQRLLGPPQRRVEDAARGRRGRGEVLDIFCPRPARAHVAQRRALLAGVGEREAGEAARRRHHQRGAERRRMKAVGDGEAFAAGLPFARRHRFVGDEQIVQPAGAGQADLVGGVEHACRGTQQVARVAQRERLQEGLRRQPAPAAEQMMQVGRRDAGGVGDRLDLGLRAPIAADMGDGAAHHVVIGRRGGQRGEAWEVLGDSRFCQGHGHDQYLGRGGGRNHPISGLLSLPAERVRIKKSPFSSPRAWPRRGHGRAPARNSPSRPARGNWRSPVACRATPGTAARCRIPRGSPGRA